MFSSDQDSRAEPPLWTSTPHPPDGGGVGPELAYVLLGGDRLLRECLKHLLRSGFRSFGEFESWSQLAGTDLSEPPHLVIVLEPANSAGFAREAQQLKAKWSQSRVIVLARALDGLSGANGLDPGIDSVLSLSMGLDALIHAIWAIALTEGIYFTAIAKGTRPDRGDSAESVGNLTPRQCDILAAIAEGRPNKIIARQLGISEATVKVQVRAVLRKIGAENRTQAAVWAKKSHRHRNPEEVHV